MNPRVEELWAEHKRFVLAIGAGLIALFAGLGTAGSIEAAAERRARTNLQKERNIESLVAALEGREGFSLGVAEALAKRVGPELRAAIELAPRQGFTLVAGETEGIVHFQALERVRAAQAEARKRGVVLPQVLALDEKPPPERIAEQLALLDMCERLLVTIATLRIPRVDTFRAGEVEYHALGEPEAPAASRGDDDDDDRAASRRAAPGAAGGADALPSVLRRLPIVLTVTGPLDTVQALMASVQRPGSVLEVDKLRVERAADDQVKLEVELAALALVRPADAPAAALAATRRADTSRLTRRRGAR